MTKISRTAILEVPVEVAYQVVQDVERYPEFLPGCDAVEVAEQTDEGLKAHVRVSGAGMQQSFVTANAHHADSITMSLIKGPFRSLEGRWHFFQIADQGCRVQVDIDFSVGGVLGGMFAPIADVVANKLVDAFCQRMEDMQAGRVERNADR